MTQDKIESTGGLENVEVSQKEPWEMMREDYLNKTDEFPELPPRTKLAVKGGLVEFDRIVSDWHRKFVEDAIKKRKPVPASVLTEWKMLKKDYPDFAKKAPPLPAEVSQREGVEGR